MMFNDDYMECVPERGLWSAKEDRDEWGETTAVAVGVPQATGLRVSV
jgi:hypothetical protein